MGERLYSERFLRFDGEIIIQISKHGFRVEVIEPVWLRERVKEENGRMGKKYGAGHEMGEVGE